MFEAFGNAGEENFTAENSEEHEYNTLSHYLAMHDDLYCSLIYQQFAFNPLLRESCDPTVQGWKDRIGLAMSCGLF